LSFLVSFRNPGFLDGFLSGFNGRSHQGRQGARLTAAGVTQNGKMAAKQLVGVNRDWRIVRDRTGSQRNSAVFALASDYGNGLIPCWQNYWIAN